LPEWHLGFARQQGIQSKLVCKKITYFVLPAEQKNDLQQINVNYSSKAEREALWQWFPKWGKITSDV